MSSKKVVETSKTPDGRFIWQIGEIDAMGTSGFACLFIDKQSGEWTRKTKDVEYWGEFFPSRAEAAAAGRATLSRWAV